jgi:P pilus assembly chaperone PapD
MFPRLFSCLAAVLFALPFATQASGVSVSPTHFISATPSPQVLTFSNGSPSSVSYQIEMRAWSQATGKDELVLSRDVLVSPTQITLPPGSQRTVRLMLMRPIPPQGLFYRLVARQLPPPADGPRKKGLTVLINQSLPVAYEPTTATPAHLVAHAVGGHLTLTNDGGQHAAVSAVGPASGKPLRTGALGWILPGATIAQPDAVAAGQALTVDVNGKPQALTVQ